MIFMATINGWKKKISPSSLGAVVGSGIQDPGWKKSGTRFRDKYPGSATLLPIPVFCYMFSSCSVVDPDPVYLLNNRLLHWALTSGNGN
jgi:hypothetical protein